MHGRRCRESRGKELLDLCGASPRARSTVLIQGESGTGKELVARSALLERPRRRAFVAVNCKAFAEGVLESELFGTRRRVHRRAAARAGCFERATGGTTVSRRDRRTSPDSSQLLRVLQDGEVLRVGGTQLRKVDVRVRLPRPLGCCAMTSRGRAAAAGCPRALAQRRQVLG